MTAAAKEYTLLALGAGMPLVLTAMVFLSKRCFAPWAKLACSIATLAGLGWAIIGFVIWPAQDVHTTHSQLVGIKDLFAGTGFGLMLAVFIARPYRKRETQSAQADLTKR